MDDEDGFDRTRERAHLCLGFFKLCRYRVCCQRNRNAANIVFLGFRAKGIGLRVYNKESGLRV